MAYAILVIGAVYTLFWLLSFLFSLKTTGQRSVIIPLAMLLLFGSVAGAGVFFLGQAPEEFLTVDKYIGLSKGMTKEEVTQKLGDEKIVQYSTLKSSLEDESRKKIFDLSANNIQMPPDVRGRLPPGKFNAKREDSRIKITIEGEGSANYTNDKRPAVGEGEVPFVRLGLPASGDKLGINGLKGLTLRFFVPDLEDEKAQIDKRKAAKDAFLANQAKIKDELKKIDQAEADARKAAQAKGKKYKPKKLSKKAKAELQDKRMAAAKPWRPEPLYVKAKDGKEWFITEGVDWKYDVKLDENNKPFMEDSFEDKNKNGMKDEGEKVIQVVKYTDEDQAAFDLCMAMNFGKDNGRCKEKASGDASAASEEGLSDAEVNAFPFVVYRDIYEDPAQLILTIAHPDFLGKEGNIVRVQSFHYTGSATKDPKQKYPLKLNSTAQERVLTKNQAIKIGRYTDGESHSLRQGAHSASLQFWYEEDPIMDDDFNSKPRMIVAGYVSDKLVCVGQFGLDLGENKEPLPYAPAEVAVKK